MTPLIRNLILATICFSAPLTAKTVNDIELEDELTTLSEETLVLNGAGVRSKFFMDLYVGSLYSPNASNNLDELLDAPIIAIRLNITSGMITADKMRDAIEEGFEDATQGNVAPIQTQIDAFMALFSAPIVDGDQFTFTATKDLGVTAYKNEIIQAMVEGEAFRRALINIWLGETPAQDSLKKAMLGE